MIGYFEISYRFLVASALYAVVGAAFTSHQREEAISGTVAAYSALPQCLNGNEYRSMVIHVQKPTDHHTSFLRVEFSLPCGQSADWLSKRPELKTFHLVRDRNCDQTLDEYIEFSDTETHQKSAIARWKRPSGTAGALPFGQVLPCYRSVDLPYVPVL